MEENKELENNVETNTSENNVVEQPVIEEQPKVEEVKIEEKPVVEESVPIQPDLDKDIIQPTVNVENSSNTDNTVQNNPVDNNDYSLKKPDFIIKSKKDTVAEEVEKRNKKIQEKIDKANANYKPNSKFKNFVLIFFFILLFFFILFLPEIRTFVLSLQNANNEETKITNGYLECTLNKTSDKYDLTYSSIFKFKNNKLYYLTFESITKGDSVNDADELKEMYNTCKNLKKQVDNTSEDTGKSTGVTISCDNNSGKVTKTETFDYENLDKEKITAAFTEAEGTYPEYDLDDDMDKIEKEMNMSGYSCKRKAN